MRNIHREITDYYNFDNPLKFIKDLWFIDFDDFFIWLSSEFISNNMDWVHLNAWSPYPISLLKLLFHIYMTEKIFLNDYVFKNWENLNYDCQINIFNNYYLIFYYSHYDFISQLCFNSAIKYESFKKFYDNKKECEEEILISNIQNSIIRKYEKKVEKLNIQINCIKRKMKYLEMTENRELDLIKFSWISNKQRLEIIGNNDKSLNYYPDNYFVLSDENLKLLDNNTIDKLFVKSEKITKKDRKILKIFHKQLLNFKKIL